MPVPQVAIVGRPNVGKSSLFNWLARRRLAIVDDHEGVTRDRMTTLIEQDERFFELIDTGGMGIEDPDDLTADVRRRLSWRSTRRTSFCWLSMSNPASCRSMKRLLNACEGYNGR